MSGYCRVRRFNLNCAGFGCVYLRFIFPYTVRVFDPDKDMPRINRGMVYLGACLIAGIRLARERQVNARVIPTRIAIEESVDLAHEIFNCVFRKVPEKMESH
jgi:hypothetical protein